MAKRVLLETDKRLLLKFLWIMGFRAVRSVRRHKRRLRRGQFFPPFLHISVTNHCNLRCQGCWVDVSAPPHFMEADALDRLIRQSKAMGNAYYGIMGGEPLLHGELLDILARHRDCYFQIFTNGHYLTDDVAARMRSMGNISPLVSIEGDEVVSDTRRGRTGVWDKSIEGLHNALKHKLPTGVATSLCRSNIDDLLTEAWIDRLIDWGVFYAWFHIYRPSGPDANPQLALSSEQQRQARKFVVEMRIKKPIAIVDAYYDGRGRAFCPTATGISNHISPWGDIEPCPVIQMAADSIHDERPLFDVFNDSAFLRDYHATAAGATRGCIYLERPELLKELADRHNAKDSTARGTFFDELAAAERLPSQYNPGEEIPEKSWLYRFIKSRWFNDFGMYTGKFDAAKWKSAQSEEPTNV